MKQTSLNLQNLHNLVNSQPSKKFLYGIIHMYDRFRGKANIRIKSGIILRIIDKIYEHNGNIMGIAQKIMFKFMSIRPCPNISYNFISVISLVT